jgi:hypothetical protein
MVQGIFNIIAQQDQYANSGTASDSRTIAPESKRDGASMKTIVVGTMFFFTLAPLL